MKNRFQSMAAAVVLLALLLGGASLFQAPPVSEASGADRLLITEIVPAPKAKGEPFEYVELYNPTDRPIDLTGYRLYYYTDMLSPEPWRSVATAWDIVAMDEINGGKTDMSIRPGGTKVVWLVKKGYAGTVRDFNEEYGSGLGGGDFVYVRLDDGQGLANDEQRYVAVAGPDGERISMAAYNVNAGTGTCKYAPRPGEKACDFVRKEGRLAESVTFFYPENGFDPDSRLMGRKVPYSIHQVPTPGSLAPARGQGVNADVLLITEVVPAPKTDGEHFEYIELYNPTDSEIDLTGHRLYLYEDASNKEPWTSSPIRWDIVANDNIAGGKTDMTIRPKSAKIVWLVKPNFRGSVQDFNKEYGTDLKSDQFVFVKLSGGQGLPNDQQRFLSIARPGGDSVDGRISMIGYNEEAGSGKCKYVAKEGEAACDFARRANLSAESVNYFYPTGGLDPRSRMMERRGGESVRQQPTPGYVFPSQLDGKPAAAIPGNAEDDVPSGTVPGDAANSGTVLITEIVPAPKTDGEHFEYIELYNAGDGEIDLTGYRIYYFDDTASREPWKSKVARWDIVALDDVAGGAADMKLAPKSVKVVWLVKPGFKGTVHDFNKEYGSDLPGSQFVFVKLGAGQGLANDQKRYVAVAGPGADPVNGRISMVSYNDEAGSGKCKYVAKAAEAACDFSRKANVSTESVDYFLPLGGLDPASRLMDRRNPDSLHRQPTPGRLTPEQEKSSEAGPYVPPAIGSLIITELVPAPKTEAEIFEYIELYNRSDKPIDLTGYKIYYYQDMTTAEPWNAKGVKRWNVVASNKISGGPTNMAIEPGGVKIVWLLKKAYGEVLTVDDFNEEYGTSLQADQFVFVKLGDGEGLDNSVQRYVSIVGPRGDQVADRISMAAYNVEAGKDQCKYTPKEGEAGCDFVRKSDSLSESVNYFYPANGLDPVNKLMERRGKESVHQTPTPGTVLPAQAGTPAPDAPAAGDKITETAEAAE